MGEYMWYNGVKNVVVEVLMDNNDLLIRLRYALDIKDTDMVKMFELGGVEVSKEEVRKMLIKSDDGYHDEARSHDEEVEEKKVDKFIINI